MRRREVLFAVIGGIVGAVLVMAAGSFAPLGAQNEAVDLHVGEITCTGLKVVDSQDIPRVTLKRHGVIIIDGVDGNSMRGRGVVSVSSKDRNTLAMMIINKEGTGGQVIVGGKDRSSATMNIGEHGGRVDVYGKEGETDARVTMSIGGVGHGEVGGRVDAFDHAGRVRAIMSASENGGLVFGY